MEGGEVFGPGLVACFKADAELSVRCGIGLVVDGIGAAGREVALGILEGKGGKRSCERRVRRREREEGIP